MFSFDSCDNLSTENVQSPADWVGCQGDLRSLGNYRSIRGNMTRCHLPWAWSLSWGRRTRAEPWACPTGGAAWSTRYNSWPCSPCSSSWPPAAAEACRCCTWLPRRHGQPGGSAQQCSPGWSYGTACWCRARRGRCHAGSPGRGWWWPGESQTLYATPGWRWSLEEGEGGTSEMRSCRFQAVGRPVCSLAWGSILTCEQQCSLIFVLQWRNSFQENQKRGSGKCSTRFVFNRFWAELHKSSITSSALTFQVWS